MFFSCFFHLFSRADVTKKMNIWNTQKKEISEIGESKSLKIFKNLWLCIRDNWQILQFLKSLKLFMLDPNRDILHFNFDIFCICTQMGVEWKGGAPPWGGIFPASSPAIRTRAWWASPRAPGAWHRGWSLGVGFEKPVRAKSKLFQSPISEVSFFCVPNVHFLSHLHSRKGEKTGTKHRKMT